MENESGASVEYLPVRCERLIPYPNRQIRPVDANVTRYNCGYNLLLTVQDRYIIETPDEPRSHDSETKTRETGMHTLPELITSSCEYQLSEGSGGGSVSEEKF